MKYLAREFAIPLPRQERLSKLRFLKFTKTTQVQVANFGAEAFIVIDLQGWD